jgi:hypothetical protein
MQLGVEGDHRVPPHPLCRRCRAVPSRLCDLGFLGYPMALCHPSTSHSGSPSLILHASKVFTGSPRGLPPQLPHQTLILDSRKGTRNRKIFGKQPPPRAPLPGNSHIKFLFLCFPILCAPSLSSLEAPKFLLSCRTRGCSSYGLRCCARVNEHGHVHVGWGGGGRQKET